MNNSSTTVAASHRFTLLALTFLFFMWGFITSLNDVLIPHLKRVFDLNYTQAMLVQLCFFGAYFLVSVPAGRLVSAIGYRKGIALGLLTAAGGCLLFIPSARIQEYWMFLSALFVLASGITLLQVAANPLVTLLGKPETASSRLTLTQAFNSLGTTIAPIAGGILLFADNMSDKGADAVVMPYTLLAATLIIIGITFARFNLPEPQQQTDTAEGNKPGSALWFLAFPRLTLGAIGIFLYVGAEVAIGSFIVNFLGLPSVAGMAEHDAANYLAWYWAGAMIGRFIGAAVMQKVSAGKLLAFNSGMSIVLLALTMLTSGQIAVWAVLAVGLCNSVMFPTIFSLSLQGLGEHTGKASGLLCLAIVGGAIVPVLQGMIADIVGVQLSFILPMACYIFIGYFGLLNIVSTSSSTQQEVSA